MAALTRVEFTVLGLPQPQGSKTVVQQRGRRPRAIEDNPLTTPWRATVTAAAQAAMDGRQLRSGPLRLHVVFVFPRPAGHFGTGRNEGQLKPSAPLYVPKRPDVDKLLRAIGDSLSGVVFRDDAQVVIVRAEKHYGTPPCAHVVVDELDLEDDRLATYDPTTPTRRRERMNETPTIEPTSEPIPDPDPTPEPEPDTDDGDDTEDEDGDE